MVLVFLVGLFLCLELGFEKWFMFLSSIDILWFLFVFYA